MEFTPRAQFIKKAVAGAVLVSLIGMGSAGVANASTPKAAPTKAPAATQLAFSADLAPGSDATVTPQWLGDAVNGVVDAVAGGVAGAYAAAKFASPAAEEAEVASSSSSSSSSSGNAQIFSNIAGDNTMDIQFNAPVG